MLAELLATLAGHPSSLFASSSQPGAQIDSLRVRDDLDFLHPSEIEILNHLATYCTRYVRIKRFAEEELENARQRAIRAALKANSLLKSKNSISGTEDQVTFHLVPLCSTLLSILSEYRDLVLETERNVLAEEADLVAHGGFVSLANLRARFECWNAPLTALDDLVKTLLRGPNQQRNVPFASEPDQPGGEIRLPPHNAPPTWTGGLLIDLLSLKASSGVRRIAEHMSRLRDAVEESWMNGLVAWVCRGEIYRTGGIADSHAGKRSSLSKDQLVRWVDTSEAGEHNDPDSGNADGLEDWVVSSTSTWAFQKDALPETISEATADSILYVGRALHTIRNSGAAWDQPSSQSAVAHRPKGPPDSMMQQHEQRLRQQGVRPSRPSELDRTIQAIRNDVSEWIFRNILTTNLVLKSLHTLGEYFLHRNGPYTLSLLHEVDNMRKNKLFRARSAAAGMIRASDMELSLHRASVGTSAEDDPSLSKLRFVLPKGSFRPSLAAGRSAKVRESATNAASRASTLMPSGTSVGSTRFDDILVGVPAQLHYTASFPLDLFLSPADLAIYSRIFSYLVAMKKVHSRVLGCWTDLSKNQRMRRKFTGTGEGGVDKKEEMQRARLLRRSCGLVRDMLWFLDTLLGHFQTDIIDVQYTRLIEQLQVHSPDIVSQQRERDLDGMQTASGWRDRKDSAQRSSSPAASVAAGLGGSADAPMSIRQRKVSGSTMGLSRTSNAGPHGSGSAPRRLAFPVSGPASYIAGPPSLLAGRAGRRFPSTSTRPESVADGATSAIPEGPAAAAETGESVLDFASLRAAHAAFLAFIQDGVLLSSPIASSLVRSILEVCDHFVGVVERWGGDVLPSLLSDSAPQDGRDESGVIADRLEVISDTSSELSDKIAEFFRLLSTSSGSSTTQLNASSLAGSAADESGITSLSVLTSRLNLPREAKLDLNSTSTSARKHLEQLLLRLDYSGYFERMQQQERAERQERLREEMITR